MTIPNPLIQFASSNWRAVCGSKAELQTPQLQPGYLQQHLPCSICIQPVGDGDGGTVTDACLVATAAAHDRTRKWPSNIFAKIASDITGLTLLKLILKSPPGPAWPNPVGSFTCAASLPALSSGTGHEWLNDDGGMAAYILATIRPPDNPSITVPLVGGVRVVCDDGDLNADIRMWGTYCTDPPESVCTGYAVTGSGTLAPSDWNQIEASFTGMLTRYIGSDCGSPTIVDSSVVVTITEPKP